MYNAPSYLRAQVSTTTKAPMLAMSASVKVKGTKGKTEVEEIKTMCSITYSSTSVITVSPVLTNHFYVSVKKPPAKCGFYGKDCYSFKEDRIGTVHVLWRIYLKQFVSDILEGKPPKKTILFVKKLDDLMEIDDFLSSKLGTEPLFFRLNKIK